MSSLSSVAVSGGGSVGVSIRAAIFVGGFSIVIVSIEVPGQLLEKDFFRSYCMSYSESEKESIYNLCCNINSLF